MQVPCLGLHLALRLHARSASVRAGSCIVFKELRSSEQGTAGVRARDCKRKSKLMRFYWRTMAPRRRRVWCCSI